MKRICHTWSSDTRIASSRDFDAPVLARGFEIVHATPRGPHVDEAASLGVSWRELPMSRRMDPLGDARGILRLTLLFRREHFDVVHTHNAKVGLAGRLAATAAKVPVLVHTVHGFPFHEGEFAKKAAYVAAERIANQRTDAILTQSDEDTRTLRALDVIDPGRIVFVGNGVPLDRFDPARFGRDEVAAERRRIGVFDGELLVVCAARLRYDKGIVELIDGAIAARESGVPIRLALAGEPDTLGLEAVPDAVLENARRRGVLRLGRVDDMPRLYAAADIVALPSWHEGLPRALVEGAAMGKPLLTTDVSGCREVARPPMIARIVKPRDAGAIRAGLASLASDPDERAASRTANRREAVARYDVRKAADRVAALYETLLAENARRIGR